MEQQKAVWASGDRHPVSPWALLGSSLKEEQKLQGPGGSDSDWASPPGPPCAAFQPSVPHMLHCVVIAVYVSVAPPAWEPHGSDRILFIPWHARGDSPHGLNWKTPRVPAQGKLVTLVSWGFELKLFYISCSRGSLGVLKWVFYSKSLPMSAVG